MPRRKRQGSVRGYDRHIGASFLGDEVKGGLSGRWHTRAERK